MGNLLQNIVFLCILAFALAEAVATEDEMWPTIHQNQRNLARVPYPGPGVDPTKESGSCVKFDVDGSALGIEFQRTGVIAPKNHGLIFADSQGSIRIVSTLDSSQLAVWGSGTGLPMTDPLVVSETDTTYTVYVGSGATLFAVTFDTSATPYTHTVKWTKTTDGRTVIQAPRLWTAGNQIIVGTGDVTNYDNGRIYSFDSVTGDQKWVYDIHCEDGLTETAPFNMPAISQSEILMFYAVCHQIFALDNTGTLAASITGNKDDPFRSDPVLSEDDATLLVRSSSGSLFSFDVTYAAEKPADEGDPHGIGYNWSCCYKRDEEVKGTESCAYGDPAVWMNFCDSTPEGETNVPVEPYFQMAAPTITPDNQFVVLANFGLGSRPSGIWNANVTDGTTEWFFDDINHYGVIGSTQSTPAIDGNGNIFVGIDTEHGAQMLCLGSDGGVKWTRPLGDMDRIRNANPVLGSDSVGNSRMFIASQNTLSFIDEGLMCPTNTFLRECSGHGACDCQTGTCDCNKCWRGNDECSVRIDCGEHGVCDDMEGQCVCDNPCYTVDPNTNMCTLKQCPLHQHCENGECVCDSCFGGDQCLTPMDCGEHGFCSEELDQCVCDNDCFTGPNCDILKNCGHGTCVDGHCSCTDTCFFGPTCNEEVECGENGWCEAGVCECFSACYGGAMCEPIIDCGTGVCDDGVCECTNPCDGGKFCDVPETCSHHGACDVTDGCHCDGEWHGIHCENPGVHAPVHPKKSDGFFGDFIVTVLVLSSITVIGFGALIYKNKRQSGANPALLRSTLYGATADPVESDDKDMLKGGAVDL
eukprot:TRINITY_DN779808_c0_g1_i1.p1 TRINITY_DN779808_c0_g1~~TRINITY_DN779808_c0_g1_i1.p1  ORF type:complete len:810 (-),score=251.70 TRINITY_DN779808_c0_g1_i1:205-2634(-)